MAKPRSRRSRSQILLYVLSLIVVLSMALGFALTAAPQQEPTPPPSTSVPGTTSQPTSAQSTPTVTPEPTITPVPLPTTAPTDSAQTKFSFAVIGDNRGNLTVYQSLLQLVEQDGNSFMIHLGDLVNDGTAGEFQDWRETMATFTLPFYPVPGNHDAGQGTLAEYLAFTGAPGAHYSFDRGNVHFALVDSHLGYLTAEESAWLDTDLARTQQPLKIVALHYPPFDPAGSSHVMTMGNEAFMSLMRKYGVQYVFAGHIHAYRQETRNDVTYIISGGGGAPLDGTEAEGGFYHYIQVTVDGTSVQMEVQRLTP